jgi:hypothetical protein
MKIGYQSRGITTPTSTPEKPKGNDGDGKK